MDATALLNLVIGISGLGMLSGISVKSRKVRYVIAPFAIAWVTYWTIQATRLLGVSSSSLLLSAAVCAAIVGTLFVVTIPNALEYKRQTKNREQ